MKYNVQLKTKQSASLKSIVMNEKIVTLRMLFKILNRITQVRF